jgi:hypothetical protein
MRIVVAGLGRTGTQSIVAALEQLGLQTCSQRNVLTDQTLAWSLVRAARGEASFDPGWLEGVDATVGWPLCFLYEEQLRCWPDAVCLLNTRDPDAWFDSVQGVWRIMSVMRRMRFLAKARVVHALLGLLEERMGGPIDRARWTDGYRRHVEAVRDAVDPDRLVEYPLGAGWEPICDALGEAVPDTAFPRGNSRTRGEFRRNVLRVLVGRQPR